MRIVPADPASPLYGPKRELIDPAIGIVVDEFDVFWNRRIRAGEAKIASDRPGLIAETPAT